MSLHLSPQSRGPEEDLEIIERTVAQAVRAERSGVAAVCLTEHHLAGFNTYTDPFLLGAYLAAKLTTAHIALTVAQVALHHPLKLVERCNILDVLTRGRCFVALAQGLASRVETEAFGIEDLDGARVTGERIEAMLRAWSWNEDDGALDVSTSVDRGVVHARVSPAPYRRPRPLVGRATSTPETVRATAERGMPVVFSGWTSDGRAHALLDLYRDTLLAGGFDDETVEACLSWAVFTVPVIVGRTQREAEARLEDYRQVAAAGPSTRRHGATFWEREWTQREVGKTSVAVVGSPERIVDHIGESVAAGARGVRILPVQVAGRPEEQGEFLDIILEEIVPRLAPQPLPAHIVTPS